MKGRDLIIYILENHLEDKDVFEHLNITTNILTIPEAAVKLSVGEATVKALVMRGFLNSISINDTQYVIVRGDNNE